MDRNDRYKIPPQRQPSSEVVMLPYTIPADRTSYMMHCPGCEVDLRPDGPSVTFIHPSRRATPVLRQHVTLERQTYAQVERSREREVVREIEAFVGRCERCGRTYVGKVG